MNSIRSVGALFSIFLITTAFANPAHDMLSRKTEVERKGLFTSLMKSGGEPCEVTRTFYQGSGKNGDAFWNLSCKSGKSWVITIKNNSSGSTQLLSCDVLEKINAGKCFTKFK